MGIAEFTQESPVMEAGMALADAVTAEAFAEMAKGETECEVAASLLGTDNPMTGKAHSATSAGEAAKQTEVVKRARIAVVHAQAATIRARARYECARLEAWARVGEGRGAL